MFETVLVAARGPVACRVLRTCQRLGARAVSVHSEADAGARHVTQADDSVLLGPAAPELSYLDRRRVLEAARQCGATAVHPGSGALALDPALARAVLDAGLAWVGAPPEVLDRAAGALAGLGATTPGRHLAVHLLADADVVPLSVLELTSHRAGEPVLALAPPPRLEPAGLADLVAVAAQEATAAGLRGAGSVELVLRPDGGLQPWGLRPWLPVEHPVSELQHGIDLVEQQLRVAAGERTDQAVAADPHALLLRVYAQDVADAGRISSWQEPPGVRVDSGVGEGDVVPPEYDPLLATVSVAGPDRGTVLERARAALAGLVVGGLHTDLPLLSEALDAAVRSSHERRDCG